MTFRSHINLIEKKPVDDLLDRAYRLKQFYAEPATLDQKTPVYSTKSEIIRRAEAILSLDFENKKGSTPLNGESLAKIYLALAYSNISWSQLSDFLKIALLDSIHRYSISMSSKNFANILWSLARIGCNKAEDDGYYKLDSDTQTILIKTMKRISDDRHISFLTCTNILWSVAVLDFHYDEIKTALNSILELVFNEVENNSTLRNFDDKMIFQLKMFVIYYNQHLLTKWRLLLLKLNSALDDRISQMKRPQSSRSHKKVEEYLRYHCSSEFQSEMALAGGYADICFPNEKIIIEYNGPTHYNEDGTLNTHSRFRKRLSEMSGYRVFDIHYIDWEYTEDKNKFIRNFLQNTGLPLKSLASPSLTIFLPEQTTLVSAKIPQFFPIPKKPTVSKRKREEEEIDLENIESKRQRLDSIIDSKGEIKQQYKPK